MHRPHCRAPEREGTPPVSLPWVVPVGILGTAAELLTLIAEGFPGSCPDDLYPDLHTLHFDLHGVFEEAALGFCRRPEQRYALADAAMTLGEGANRLVRRWAVGQSLPAVARELAAAASVERLTRLAGELGSEGFVALLRSELASGVPVSGAALVLLDCARWTAAERSRP